MNSLIVFLPQKVRIEEVCECLSAAGMGVELQEGRAVVSMGDSLGWIEQDTDGELEREYEWAEMGIVERVLGSWVGYVIDYRNIFLADAAVAAISGAWECVIDDERGFFGRGSDYCASRG